MTDDTVTATPDQPSGPDDKTARLRLLEALLFAAADPVSEVLLAARIGPGWDVTVLLAELQEHYAPRGVVLLRVGGGWAFRTAPDIAPLLRQEEEVARRLSKAAIETLAIIAYHQPVTRGEIEQIRGVTTSKGTLDILMENGWIRPGKRRESPGRPLTWITTGHFLDHFGLEHLRDLPGVEDLRAAGLLDSRPVFYGVAGGGDDGLPLPRADDGDED